jgi:phage-related protein
MLQQKIDKVLADVNEFISNTNKNFNTLEDEMLTIQKNQIELHALIKAMTDVKK